MLADWLEINQDGPLFPTKFGKPIGTRGVRKMVEDCAYRAKLEGGTLHRLCRAFCKNLVDQGVPLNQVARLAVHSSWTSQSGILRRACRTVERVAWEQ